MRTRIVTSCLKKIVVFRSTKDAVARVIFNLSIGALNFIYQYAWHTLFFIFRY